MPHQCTHCGEIYPDAAQELLAGCKCGSKFFYYIRQEKLDELNRIKSEEILGTIEELNRSDKTQIEKDIREITGLSEEPNKPVILDLESVRVISPGKFEIDIINLFSKKRPIIYKLEEGKYIIDLTSTDKTKTEEIDKKIRNAEINKEEMFKAKKEKIKADKDNPSNKVTLNGGFSIYPTPNKSDTIKGIGYKEKIKGENKEKIEEKSEEVKEEKKEEKPKEFEEEIKEGEKEN